MPPEAILRCIDPYAFNTRVLNLGDPHPVSLREFLLVLFGPTLGARQHFFEIDGHGIILS